jgi:hypothetical protein
MARPRFPSPPHRQVAWAANHEEWLHWLSHVPSAPRALDSAPEQAWSNCAMEKPFARWHGVLLGAALTCITSCAPWTLY